MELPEFEYNNVFNLHYINRKIPMYFEWNVEAVERTNEINISAEFKSFNLIGRYMSNSTPEREEVYSRFCNAYTFLLSTERYREMFDDHINQPVSMITPNVLRSIHATLAMWSQIESRPRDSVIIYDDDVIKHFFGIEPLPDRKVFSLL